MKKKQPQEQSAFGAACSSTTGREWGCPELFLALTLGKSRRWKKKLYLNLQKSFPSTGEKLENGAQALCNSPSCGLVGAGGSHRIGRGVEDPSAITQHLCRGLGAPLGAAGPQCTLFMAQGLQLPLCSRLRWPRAHSQGRSSKNLAIKQSLESCRALPWEAPARKSPGHRQEPVTPWARPGGRGRKHLSSHSHLIIG